MTGCRASLEGDHDGRARIARHQSDGRQRLHRRQALAQRDQKAALGIEAGEAGHRHALARQL
jgi:hypothetical protein